MGTLIPFPGAAVLPDQQSPTIYTPERIDQLARSNAVARQLRGLGYRILDEDIWPDDGGMPIIQVEVSEIGDRSIRHLGEGLSYYADHNLYRTRIDDVRVCWNGEA